MLTPYKYKNPRVLQRNDLCCANLCVKEIVCVDDSGKVFVEHVLSLAIIVTLRLSAYCECFSLCLWTRSCNIGSLSYVAFNTFTTYFGISLRLTIVDGRNYSWRIHWDRCLLPGSAVQSGISDITSGVLSNSNTTNSWFKRIHMQFCLIYPAIIDAFEEFRYHVYTSFLY